MAAPEKWYFTREKLLNSPSKRCGLELETELSHRQQAANLIQDMGQRLQVSQLCINTAIVYMHRFYAFHSFSHFHRNSIAAAALFLAAKVEEQPRKLEYVIKVAHMCLHRSDRAPALDIRSEVYQEQAQDLVFNENVLLQTLGFDVAIDHPHTHVLRTCQLVKAPRDLVQTSYFMASNSLHLTTMCLQHKPTVVACFCIHLASKWSNWAIPQSNEGHPWFHYVDRSVTTELLERLTTEFLAIFEKYPSRLKKRMMSLNSSAAGISSPHSGITAQQPQEGMSGGQQTPLQPPIASLPFDHKKGVVTTEDIEKFDKEYEKRHLSGYATTPLTSSQPPAQFAHQPHLPNKLDYREYREKKEREERDRRSREQAGAAPRPQQPHPNRHHGSSSAHPIAGVHSAGVSAHPTGTSVHTSANSAHPSSSSSSNNPAAAAGHHRQWSGAHHPKHGPQPHPSKTGQQPVPRPSSSNRPSGTHHHHRHHPPNMPQPNAIPEAALAVEPPRQRPPSLFSPENTTPVAPKKPMQAAALPPNAPIRRTSSAPHPNHLKGQTAVPHNIMQAQIPTANVPPKNKRPESHVREMAPPPPLSPFRSPLSNPVSLQASNLMVTPPSNKARSRTSSSSSEPELIPVVKKLEETPGYENVIRDSQRHTAIRVKPERPSALSPPRPSLNGIETDPALVSSLLKESLSRVPPSNLLTADSANFLDKSANEASHYRAQTNHAVSASSLLASQSLHPSTIPEAAIARLAPDPEKVVEVTQSAPGEQSLDAHHSHRRSEKKKKKEKHKHKDRDKDKSRDERKKHKKDKDREKKRQENSAEPSEHSISVPDGQPASLATIKITIPRDKLAVSPGSTPGFKIKIPKDRIERVPATAPSHSLPQQPPSAAIKIKISKDVLDSSRKRSAMPNDEQPPLKTQRHNGLGHRNKIVPPKNKRPESHVREMAPPPPLSPFRSPLSNPVSLQASNLMVTPPSNKARSRTSSSSSEPELIPVVKKLEETPGYENVIRDSQRHTAIRVKPERPSALSPPRPSLNGIETDPALVSSLLKESLSRGPPSNLLTADSANFLDKSANEASHYRAQTNHAVSASSLLASQSLHPSTIPEAAIARLAPDPEKVVEVTQSAPGEQKKDKDREKKRQENSAEPSEHSISVPDGQPASLATIKITIPRDKLAVSPGSMPGFKIKIPKDRIERVPATARSHSLPQQPPSAAIKIKISKDVLDSSRKRSAMPNDEQPPLKTQRHNGLGHRNKVVPVNSAAGLMNHRPQGLPMGNGHGSK